AERAARLHRRQDHDRGGAVARPGGRDRPGRDRLPLADTPPDSVTFFNSVMAGLVAAIHVDHRDKPGDDGRMGIDTWKTMKPIPLCHRDLRSPTSSRPGGGTTFRARRWRS